VATGHQPHGDCPLVLATPQVVYITADTSYSENTKWEGVGTGVGMGAGVGMGVGVADNTPPSTVPVPAAVVSPPIPTPAPVPVPPPVPVPAPAPAAPAVVKPARGRGSFVPAYGDVVDAGATRGVSVSEVSGGMADKNK
jgi:hypothetical protein